MMSRFTDSDIERGREILRMNRFSRGECPHCGEPLESDSGQEGIPAHQYCPLCMDVAYDDDGNILFKFD